MSSQKLRESRAGPTQGRIADWFREFRAPLRKFIARRRSLAPCDLDDVAQEVFLRLMRVEHHETIRSPEAYLFTVASHVLHQYTLRQASAPASIDIAEVFAELQLTSDDDPLARAEGQQRLAELQRILVRLPPRLSSKIRKMSSNAASMSSPAHPAKSCAASRCSPAARRP